MKIVNNLGPGSWLHVRGRQSDRVQHPVQLRVQDGHDQEELFVRNPRKIRPSNAVRRCKKVYTIFQWSLAWLKSVLLPTLFVVWKKFFWHFYEKTYKVMNDSSTVLKQLEFLIFKNPILLNKVMIWKGVYYFVLFLGQLG
jgi:hypothetical protein